MENNNNQENGPKREVKIRHSLITFAILIACMSYGIIRYDAGVHVSMFIGVCGAACVALYLGFKWEFIEEAMKKGIYNSLQAVMILIIVGILIGVWIVTGVVPAMIYYGLKLLSPRFFLVAALLICSITSLATGTSWGTMGTMGLALIGVAMGLGIPTPVAAGAIISGAYFGDKMSPLSDTTNLAPAMAGTDVFTHVKFMMKPTGVAYGITFLFYLVYGFRFAAGGGADLSGVEAMSTGIAENFNINLLLLLPPVIVIVAIACKIPAIPGITLGAVSAAILGLLIQPGVDFGDLLTCGYAGFTANTGDEAVDSLLTSGGISNMLYSVSLTIIAMMFGGIMEATGLLQVLVSKLVKLAKKPASLVLTTELTCLLSNIVMPEQYISIVVPGRMYADTYKEKGLHPKTLSNALESSGTVTSALVPWNTCGAYIFSVLGVHTIKYLPYCTFNLIMPIVTVVMAYMGYTVADKYGFSLTRRAQRKEAELREKGELEEV
ncbi:MAG: Na+/H+ antiporter NhaC [Anaerovoracaceae bacterium]|jgi:NhaC family Na+:H+ antiporter